MSTDEKVEVLHTHTHTLFEMDVIADKNNALNSGCL